MAESDALIPYPSSREIILRHKDSIVVFDPDSRRLVSRNASHTDVSNCPYCHRPIPDRDSSPSGARSTASPVTAAANYATPEYFRMLQGNQIGSNESSRPSSPHKRIQSGLPGLLNGRTPPNAEFVGSSPAPGAKHGISTTAFSPNYFKNFFVEEKELGRGNKGVVLLVRHLLDGVSLGHFALKRIPVGHDHKWLEKVLIEVQLLQHLSHQNLVSYRHVWLEEMQITTFGPSVPCAFILQQYCNAGDLQKYILGGLQTTTSKEELKQRIRRRSKGGVESKPELGPRKLQFEEIAAFFKDIASGLNHLHTHNFIHRDLKPNNCLLHQNGKDLRVLVSDFGEVQSEDQVRSSTGATGTISYCSPEVLRVDPATGRLGNFSAKSDIFSLGMILYFLCFAQLPYHNADTINEEQEDVDLLRDEIVHWIGLGDLRKLRSDLPEKLYVFLRRLLSLDPVNRPTAEEILQSIKTGSSLNEPDERASEMIDDQRDGRRISAVDTPIPTTRRSSIALSRLSRQPPPSKLRFPVRGGSKERDESTDEDEPLHSATSLVLRSRHTSPARLALPLPEIGRTDSRWYRSLIFQGIYLPPQMLFTFKVVSLLVKILSMYLLCMPAATEPRVGLSLLAIALLDLLEMNFGLLSSVILLGLHTFALVLLDRRGGLCLAVVSRVQDWTLEHP